MKTTRTWKKVLAAAMSAAIAFSSTASMTAFAQGETSFLDQLNANYNQPDQSFMTENRWWLPEGGHTDETIIEEIQSMHDQGFTGIELCLLDERGTPHDTYGYGSESWAHDVKLAIETAAGLNMRVGLTSGTHWRCANIPGLDPNSNAAGQELGISTTYVQAGQSISGALTLPAGRSGVAVEAITRKFAGAFAYHITRDGARVILDMTKEPIDLSDDVVRVDNQTFTLDFTAPEDGEYVVYAMWQQGTFQSQEPSQETSYAINYYHKDGVNALKNYLEGYYFSDPELVEVIRDADIQFFMDSLEIDTSSGRTRYWSDDWREEFINRKGYDILPYMPIIATNRIGSGVGTPDPNNAQPTGNLQVSTEDDASAADNYTTWTIMCDAFDVQTQMIVDNMMNPLKEWAQEKYNMELRAQLSYGTSMETSEMGLGADYIETESLNMKDQTDTYRVWAGAAHIKDTLYSSETACIFGAEYFLTEQDYIKIANLQFAGGVNRTIWHGHASSWGPVSNTKWPGYEGMYASLSSRLDSREPNSKDYREMNSYFGRVQQLLREGVSRTDLGILRLNYGERTEYGITYADYIGNHHGIYWQDMSLQDAGYTYDYFSPDYLNLVEYDPETQTLGETVGYQAVLLHQQRLPVDAAKRLLELARQGLKVILVGDSATITPYHSETNEQLAAVVNELKALDNVAVVETEADAYPALLAMDVTPRAELIGTNQILTQVREDEDDNLYVYAYNYCDDEHKFLQNRNYQPESHGTLANADMAVDGLYIPYSIDPWTGEVGKIADYRYENGRTVINLTLEYNDVALLAFEPAGAEELHAVFSDADLTNRDGTFSIRATQSGTYNTILSDGSAYETTLNVPAAAELTGWNLNVEDWTPGDPEYRSETRRTTVYDAASNTYDEVDLETTEVRYATNKDILSAKLDSLTTWENIPEIGKDVSGIGYYTTTFSWDASAASGAYLDLGSFLQSAVVLVNGQRTAPVDVVDAVVDIGGLLKDGENELEIIVTSTLANRLLEKGIVRERSGSYDGREHLVNFNGYECTYQSNGLSSVTLIPYAEAQLPAETEAVLSASAPETAQVGADFDVTVVADASVTDVKLFNEYDLAIGAKNVAVSENEDGTKTFVITVSAGTVGERTFKVVTKGPQSYYKDSGKAVSIEITSVPPVLSSFDLPETAVANRTFIVKATTDMAATKIAVYNEFGTKMGLRSLSYKVVDGQKVWTGVMAIGTKGERTFTAYAVNKYGVQSEALTDSISVKAFA